MLEKLDRIMFAVVFLLTLGLGLALAYTYGQYSAWTIINAHLAQRLVTTEVAQDSAAL